MVVKEVSAADTEVVRYKPTPKIVTPAITESLMAVILLLLERFISFPFSTVNTSFNMRSFC